VLKRKVVELYDGSDGSAVREQIARMRQRQEEARRKRQLMEVRAAELVKHNAHLEAEVADRTRALRNILDNVTFGFLVVGRDLAVQEGFTRSCAELLGRPVAAGQPFAELLGLDEGRTMELELGFDLVFEDLMPEEVTLGQLPQRMEAGALTLQIEGRALRGDDGEVTSILFTISDITPLLAARDEARRNARLVHLLRQRPAFESFVRDTRELLQTCTARIEDQEVVRRLVHTVKGNAASFQLDEVAHACHQEESAPSIDAAAIERLHDAMRTVLATFEDVVPVTYDGDVKPEVRVDPRALERLQALLSCPDNLDQAQEAARQLTLRPATDLLGPIESFTALLGERLGKQVSLEAEGLGTPVDPFVMQPVLRTVSHLIRNAVDHGIEPEEARQAKDPVGHVALRVEEDDAGYCVVIADDGAGIDTEAVVARAVERGWVTSEEVAGMGEEERCGLIFRDGLSLAAQTTDISGRGVGMSAVRQAVEDAHGTIQIETMVGRGTTFTLRIPRAA